MSLTMCTHAHTLTALVTTVYLVILIYYIEVIVISAGSFTVTYINNENSRHFVVETAVNIEVLFCTGDFYYFLQFLYTIVARTHAQHLSRHFHRRGLARIYLLNTILHRCMHHTGETTFSSKLTTYGVVIIVIMIIIKSIFYCHNISQSVVQYVITIISRANHKFDLFNKL